MGTVVYRKPLHGLCRIILKHEDYIARTGDAAQTRAVKKTSKENIAVLAKKVATSICQRLGMEPNDEEYLFKDGAWMDPGPIVSMKQVFADWETTPLRPMGAVKVPVEDILLGQWICPSKREVEPEPETGRKTRTAAKARVKRK